MPGRLLTTEYLILASMLCWLTFSILHWWWSCVGLGMWLPKYKNWYKLLQNILITFCYSLTPRMSFLDVKIRSHSVHYVCILYRYTTTHFMNHIQGETLCYQSIIKVILEPLFFLFSNNYVLVVVVIIYKWLNLFCFW